MKILNSNININGFFNHISKSPSLLLLDYDGTLAPFVKNRLEAFPYPGVKEQLLSLLSLKNVRVVIISGRSLIDLETVIKINEKLECWGSHGMERKAADGTITYAKLDPIQRAGIDRGIKVCQENVEPHQCEIKPFAVAVHWRGTEQNEHSPSIQKIKEIWLEITKSHNLDLHHFDHGIELRPKGQNKGDVINTLLAEVSQETPIAYLGDDATDEDAFAALGNRGLKVLVKKELHPTLADIAITPPEELLGFLNQWITSAQKSSEAVEETLKCV